MYDRDFLIWIHERLEHVYGEDALVDYMHKLRDIIANTNYDRISESSGTNSLNDLLKKLEE